MKYVYSADFETTTNIEKTKVWLWAIVNIKNINREDVKIGHTINSFFSYLYKLSERNTIYIYFFNLKFDGLFILDFLYKKGFTYNENNIINKNEFNYITDDKRTIYQIKLKINHKYIYIRCSYRISLTSLSDIAESFNTKFKKTEIDYKRHNEKAKVTKNEIKYIQEDVLIQAEFLQHYINEFDKVKLTIGSQALNEFYNIEKITKKKYMIKLNSDVDSFIRKAYNGGLCIVNPKYKNKIIKCNGAVYDKNSMYPSMLHSSSRNFFPIGQPLYFIGKEDFKYVLHYNKLFIVHIMVNFKIKKNHIACISSIFSFMKGEKWETTTNGHKIELYLCDVDFKLLLENYDIYELEIIDGYYFNSKRKGIADNFIDKYYSIKKNNKGAKKIFAKYMLNSLSGKFGQRLISNQTIFEYNEETKTLITTNKQVEREGIYLPFIVYITAYARYELVNLINKNFDNFLYCDTDSLHLLKETDNININNELGGWKIENKILKCKYIRPKCYIDKIDKNKYNIRVAGLPKKYLKNKKITDNIFNEYSVGKVFYNVKLVPKITRGGVVLVETDFTIKE